MTDTQMDLFASQAPRTIHDIRLHLAANIQQPVQVTFTKNRSRLLSVCASREGPVRIRLSHHLAETPPRVLDALCRYVQTRHRTDWRTVTEYIRGLSPLPSQPRQFAIRTRGHIHDLGTIFEEVNRTFFEGRLQCRVTWGTSVRRSSRRNRRHIRYGSFSRERNLIRIHPALDDARVPVRFVQFIIYHEMLHAVVGATTHNGRAYCHTREFRRLERQFPGWAEMETLSAQLVAELSG